MHYFYEMRWDKALTCDSCDIQQVARSWKEHLYFLHCVICGIWSRNIEFPHSFSPLSPKEHMEIRYYVDSLASIIETWCTKFWAIFDILSTFRNTNKNKSIWQTTFCFENRHAENILCVKSSKISVILKYRLFWFHSSTHSSFQITSTSFVYPFPSATWATKRTRGPLLSI